jgi:Uma2 family endonuclease
MQSLQPSSPPLPLEPGSFKRWTAQDYHRMSELGLLHPDEKTELIAGQIILMAAKGIAHVTALQLLSVRLQEQLNGSALIRTQDPITLDDFSEPEPDLVIVRGEILDYADHHPHPEEILLVVEVADSTLQRDCEIKDKLYAQSNIEEYWVLDLPNRRLHIFRNPTATGYASHLILTAPNQATCLALPNLCLNIADVLLPVG